MYVGFVILVCVVVVIGGVIVGWSITCMHGLLRVGLTTGVTVVAVVFDGGLSFGEVFYSFLEELVKVIMSVVKPGAFSFAPV